MSEAYRIAFNPLRTEAHTYQFDVATSNHDLLREGITEAQRVRVVVFASDYWDASLMALQMAAINDQMPTGIYYVE
jgi:hypothetical protein